MEVEEKVKQVISRLLKVDIANIDIESTFTKDLGADSISLVELLLALEQEFGISIPDDEVDHIATVGDVVNYVKAHI